MITPLLALTSITTAIPQETDLTTIDFSEFLQVVSARAAYTGTMDFDGLTPGGASFSNLSLFSLLGKVETPGGLTWLPSISYELSHFDFDARPFGLAPGAPDLEDTLHNISFPNYLIWQQNDRWFHSLVVTPGIQSNFDSFDSRDFFLSFAAGSAYRVNDDLLVGAAVYGSNLTNDPFFILGAGFIWTPGDDWLVSYYGPRFVVRRDLGDNDSIAFEAAWNGGEWSIQSFNLDTRLDYSSYRAGLRYRHRLQGELWFDIAAGFTFGNEITLVSPGGRDLFPTALGTAGSSPYVHVGVSLATW